MPAAQPKSFNNKRVHSTELSQPHDDSSKTIGETFQATRKQKKLEIKQIADVLNISPRFIKAIELMDITQLPEKVYTLGFVRSYARYLDIDSQKSVEEFRNIFYNNKASSFKDSKPNLIQTNLPSRKTLFFALMILIITIVSWLVYQKTNSKLHSTMSVRRPAVLSNKVESSDFIDKNPAEPTLVRDSTQKTSKINSHANTLSPSDIIKKPVTTSDSIRQSHSHPLPVITTPKVQLHTAKLPENDQSNSIEREGLTPIDPEKSSEDNAIDSELLPSSVTTSQSN